MDPAGAGPGTDDLSMHPVVMVIALLCAFMSGVIIGAMGLFYLVNEGMVVVP